MKTLARMTTSWDDGHPLDLRVAELLARYGLRGTFYVPKSSEFGTMTPTQVREIGRSFELGGHTLHHVDLTRTDNNHARREIIDCKSWLEDATGTPSNMFCPPRGHFARQHLHLIAEAGFRGVRSVELLSLECPRQLHRVQPLVLMSTSVQAFPHRWSAYARNALKRGALRNCWRYSFGGRSGDWTRLARTMITSVMERGGVFHLWGHSWEIEQTGQWRQLDEILRFMGQNVTQAPPHTNGEVCAA